MSFPHLTCYIWTARCHSIAVSIFCPSAVAETSCKSTFLGQEYLLIEYIIISPGWFGIPWFAASPLASFSVCPNWQHLLHWFCAVLSSSSGSSPGCSCPVPSWPGIANPDSHQPLVLTLLFKEQWCELWDTWANSSWIILLRRTSFSSDCRKCCFSLSILPKLGAMSLLSSHPWLNFNRRMWKG